MKYSIILLFSLILASCTKEDISAEIVCDTVQYGQAFSVEVGDEVCFPDGYGFTVEVFEDQFCPCDAVCISAGELSILVETVNPLDEKSLVRFGSVSYLHFDTIFENAIISNLSYIYKNNQPLPDCDNDYDQEEVVLTITIDKM